MSGLMPWDGDYVDPPAPRTIGDAMAFWECHYPGMTTLLIDIGEIAATAGAGLDLSVTHSLPT
jgi:hypothetical protein